MRTGSRRALTFALLAYPFAAVQAVTAHAQEGAKPSPAAIPNPPVKAQLTDWGGGYLRGPDSASTTVATSGAGTAQPAPVVIPAAPVNVPLTDWGGGYLRGPDSASTTVATSGAGAPKPNN